MKKVIILSITFFLITTLSNAQFCNKYADKAVAQYKLAKKNNLPNINWPLWTDDWNGHYNWCKTVTEDAANKQTVFRETYLKKNIKDPSILEGLVIYKIAEIPDMSKLIGLKERISEDYAKKAVHQNQENILNSCGFKGPEWSSDYNAHKNWCLHGNNYLKAKQVLNEREKKLQSCNNISKADLIPEITKIYIPVFDKTISGFTSFNFEKGIDRPGSDYYNFWVKKGPEFEINECIKACENDIRCKSFTYVVTDRGTKARCYLKNRIPSPVVKENCISGVKNSGNIVKKNRTDQNSGYTINIPKNSIHFESLINVKKSGLYKISINLFYPNQQYNYRIKLNPSIYKEDYTVSIIPDNNTAYNKNQERNNPVLGEKIGNGFKPWIKSKKSIKIFLSKESNSIKKAFYFFVDYKHVPPNGKLRFDLDITDLEIVNSNKPSEKEDFTHHVAVHNVDFRIHPDISGAFDISYAPVQKVQSVNENNLGSEIQYTIQKIKFLKDSRMGLAVIETPEIKIYDKNKNDDEKPLLTFFIANAERLSSKTDPDLNTNSGFYVSENPNKWIYKNILTHEYGENSNCKSITANGQRICTNRKFIKKEEWDLQNPKKSSQLIDVINPNRNKYEIVISPDGNINNSLADLMTTGLILNDNLPYDDSKNEIVIATRYADPYKYTFVAELTKLEVSTQAEYDDDDDDTGFGEFSVVTTSVLSKPIDARNQIELRPDQIISRSQAFPIVDNTQSPHTIYIRPPGNPGDQPPKNAEAYTYPKMPLFVMDYDELQDYNGLLLNILVSEHDESSGWDQFLKIFNAFSSLIKSIVSTVTGFGLGSAGNLAKEIYKFALTDLNVNNGVDDFMGNAAIAIYKNKNFGLGDSKMVSYNTTGPAKKSDFDMTSISQNKGETEVSSNSGDEREITATITLRKVRKINSTANIYLISYIPVKCLYKDSAIIFSNGKIEKVPRSREQVFREGLLNEKYINSFYYSNSMWNVYSFKPVTSFKEIKIKNKRIKILNGTPSSYKDKDPLTLSFREKYFPQDLNKGILTGSEWENGKLTKNSQNWDGKGFTYYQATLNEINRYPEYKGYLPAVISFTLYHEDVVENAGKGWVDLRNNMKYDTSEEKNKYRIISINSTEIKNYQYPNQKFYQVDIKLYDPGDWLEEARFIAYVTVN